MGGDEKMGVIRRREEDVGEGGTEDGVGRLGTERGDVEGKRPGDERKEKMEKVRPGS